MDVNEANRGEGVQIATASTKVVSSFCSMLNAIENNPDIMWMLFEQGVSVEEAFRRVPLREPKSTAK